MKTRDIPEDQWPKFFDNFSSKHEGWLVTLEIFGTELGAQVQERELALAGIVDEWDEIHGNRIVILLGEQPDDHITHRISRPTHVGLEQTDGGADVGLAIKSADGIMVLLRFLSPMLPEMERISMRKNIEPLSWQSDLAAFGKRNNMRPTRLEVLGPAREVESDFWLEDGLLLAGIDLDTDGERGACVEIMLQAPSASSKNHMTHTVAAVKRLGLETTDGRDEALEIEDGEGKVTIMRFESERPAS